MEEITGRLGETISVGYIITVILLSYWIIRLWLIRACSGVKKLLTFAVGIAVGGFYLVLKIDDLPVLIPSFTIAVALYDYVIKYVLNWLNAGYRAR
jgi:hypothetical protein